MSKGFKIIVTGDYACFTRPELKVERVSYDVPTPGALEGLIKSIYWKPAIRYVIDKIIVFNPINFENIRRNEVSTKVSKNKIVSQMREGFTDPCIYTSETINQRAASILKNVMYGIDFHFELTGLRNEEEKGCDEEKKHYNILKRRLEGGQFFRVPCLGCAEFSAKKIELVEDFDLSLISEEVKELGDVDLGFMCYRMNFKDHGIPKNNEWNKSNFSDDADAIFYRPHMIDGIIDVSLYRRELKC